MLISCSFFMATFGVSIFLGALSVFLWNRGPIKWICEYRQPPDCRYEKRKLRYGIFIPAFSLLFLIYTAAQVYSSKMAIIPFPQLIIVFSLLQLSVSDIKFHILQDQWIFALAVPAFWLPCAFAERLWGLAVPALLYGVAALLYQEKKHPPMFGMGDIKLLCCLGFCFGRPGLYVISCTALLSSGFFAFVFLLLKKVTKKDRIAFGPFLSIACLYFMLST